MQKYLQAVSESVSVSSARRDWECEAELPASSSLNNPAPRCSLSLSLSLPPSLPHATTDHTTTAALKYFNNKIFSAASDPAKSLQIYFRLRRIIMITVCLSVKILKYSLSALSLFLCRSAKEKCCLLQVVHSHTLDKLRSALGLRYQYLYMPINTTLLLSWNISIWNLSLVLLITQAWFVSNQELTESTVFYHLNSIIGFLIKYLTFVLLTF